MKKYTITLQNLKDKEEFCDQMEVSSYRVLSECIPQRSCECVSKRPLSRNTTYILSEQEADNLKNDPRVKNIELALEEMPGLEITTTIFKPDPDPNHQIFGLKYDTFENITTQAIGDKYATISNVPDGNNVDVVIVDDYVEMNHPEFARNENGTGGSRVNRINWYSYDNEVLGSSSDRVYNYAINNTQSHGTHTAGTVAGNTQGWAKKANIYHIRFPSTSPPEPWADYIRAFHRNKPLINGIKNPTVTNNSWSYSFNLTNQPINNISKIVYRGTTITKPVGGWTGNILLSYGIVSQVNGNLFRYAASSEAENAEVDDMVNDGIIVVASAGNNYSLCDITTGIDYNNYFTIDYNGNTNDRYDIYYNRGCSPSASDSAISVGSIESLSEYKTLYSNCGPAVDVYAPGHAIISSVLIYEPGAVLDSRNTSYALAKFTGTSMSGPQVAGMLACIASTNPMLNQATAKNYISVNAKNTIADTNGGAGDFRSLQGSPNRYLFYSGASVSYP